jgi:hypothetical protein
MSSMTVNRLKGFLEKNLNVPAVFVKKQQLFSMILRVRRMLILQ